MTNYFKLIAQTQLAFPNSIALACGFAISPDFSYPSSTKRMDNWTTNGQSDQQNMGNKLIMVINGNAKYE